MHLLLRRPRSSVLRGVSLHGSVAAVNQFLFSLAACLLKNKFGLRGDLVRITTMPPRVINNPLHFQFGKNMKVSFRFPHFRLMKKWHKHHGTHVTMKSLQMHRRHWFLALPCVVRSTSDSLTSYTKVVPTSSSPLSAAKACAFSQLQVLSYTHLLRAWRDRKCASSFGSCSSQMSYR